MNGVEQDTDTFLKPDADDPAKVRFTMPAENVEIKANFEGNPTLNIGDHVTATRRQRCVRTERQHCAGA